jgi:hypothetical protein
MSAIVSCIGRPGDTTFRICHITCRTARSTASKMHDGRRAMFTLLVMQELGHSGRCDAAGRLRAEERGRLGGGGCEPAAPTAHTSDHARSLPG